MKRSTPPLYALQREFSYDPDIGLFYRRKKNTNWTREGEVAGYICSTHGYRFIHVLGYGYYRAHILAWKMFYGKEPNSELDHINRNRSDNRICNLREVTHLENSRNKSDYKNNKSGLRGVSWKRSHERWVSQITHKGKRIYIGLFDDKEDAHRAYLKKKEELMKVDP